MKVRVQQGLSLVWVDLLSQRRHIYYLPVPIQPQIQSSRVTPALNLNFYKLYTPDIYAHPLGCFGLRFISVYPCASYSSQESRLQATSQLAA